MSRALIRLPWRRVERVVPLAHRPQLWLAPEALAAMQTETLAWKNRETGGMLLGYRVEQEIVVQSVIGPGPGAKHRRWSFEPDATWQQAELTRIYTGTGRMQWYLGDWHSHPRGGLAPSGRDLRTARHVAASPEAQAPEPVTIILAAVARKMTLGAWALQGGAFVRARLRTLPDPE